MPHELIYWYPYYCIKIYNTNQNINAYLHEYCGYRSKRITRIIAYQNWSPQVMHLRRLDCIESYHDNGLKAIVEHHRIFPTHSGISTRIPFDTFSSKKQCTRGELWIKRLYQSITSISVHLGLIQLATRTNQNKTGCNGFLIIGCHRFETPRYGWISLRLIRRLIWHQGIFCIIADWDWSHYRVGLASFFHQPKTVAQGHRDRHKLVSTIRQYIGDQPQTGNDYR